MNGTELFRLVKPFSCPEAIPLSFVYGGVSYRGLDSSLFHPRVKRVQTSSALVQKTIEGCLPDGLRVRVEYTEYRDFPAVEWYAEFENTAPAPSCLLYTSRCV